MWTNLPSEVQAALIAAAASILTTLIVTFPVIRKIRSEMELNRAGTRKSQFEAELLKREIAVEKTRHLHDYHDKYLNVFRKTFEKSRRVQQSLLGPLADVEYHPLALRRAFQDRGSDTQKNTWYKKICFLVKQNSILLRMIEENTQPALTDAFRDKIREFKEHVRDWEDMWRDFRHEVSEDYEGDWDEDVEEMMAHTFPIPDDVTGSEANYRQRARRFPEGMDKALNGEIAAVLDRIASLSV
ncbi:MAG: hypothetical protein QNJ44_24420 [Rhodobacter sp.]|nr:hypothetical protein [Rhodobacter sp.]